MELTTDYIWSRTWQRGHHVWRLVPPNGWDSLSLVWVRKYDEVIDGGDDRECIDDDPDVGGWVDIDPNDDGGLDPNYVYPLRVGSVFDRNTTSSVIHVPHKLEPLHGYGGWEMYDDDSEIWNWLENTNHKVERLTTSVAWAYVSYEGLNRPAPKGQRRLYGWELMYLGDTIVSLWITENGWCRICSAIPLSDLKQVMPTDILEFRKKFEVGQTIPISMNSGRAMLAYLEMTYW